MRSFPVAGLLAILAVPLPATAQIKPTPAPPLIPDVRDPKAAAEVIQTMENMLRWACERQGGTNCQITIQRLPVPKTPEDAIKEFPQILPRPDPDDDGCDGTPFDC